MRGINVFIGEKDLKDRGNQVAVRVDGEELYVTARSIGYQSFWHQVWCAWLVLREKADIVIWKYQ